MAVLVETILERGGDPMYSRNKEHIENPIKEQSTIELASSDIVTLEGSITKSLNNALSWRSN